MNINSSLLQKRKYEEENTEPQKIFKKDVNFAKSLFPQKNVPYEIAKTILSFLSLMEVRKSSLLNHAWNQVSNQCLEESLTKKILIGVKGWKKFGKITKVPALPPDIEQILKGDCPFNPEKKVYETHTLVLIPEKINDESL